MKEYRKLLHYKKLDSPLNLNQFQQTLFKTFESKKILIDNQTNDPAEAFHIITNSLHSYYLVIINLFKSKKESLCDHIDTVCKNKCFSHNYLWLDICKIDVNTRFP